MNSLYLDTNVFLYLSDNSSPFHLSCVKLIRYCRKEKILIATSAETVQEIIHYTKNIKQPKLGLKAAKETLKIINELITIDQSVIERYLRYVQIYKNSGSRDLIHLAACLENKINKIVTFDKDFDKFKELKVVVPTDLNSS